MNFIDLQRQYKMYKEEIDAEIQKVLDSSAYVFGAQIKELEEKLSDYCGIDHAIACASGTDALLLAIMALELKPGDEIITTPFTFIATAEIPALFGIKPVFVDIDADTYNINPDLIENAITEKTKAIITVDIFGQIADMKKIEQIAKKHSLFIIEDAAQSFGAIQNNAKACSFGDISTTSFFPAKPLGCYGDGGMVFTKNQELAQKIISLRNHGQGEKYQHKYIGVNARLDTIQAAVLLVKFKYYENEISLRQEKAAYYNKELKDFITVPKIKENNRSVYAQYSIQSGQREKITAAFQKNKIPFAIHYPIPLHLQPCFNYLGYKQGDFPVAEELSNRIMSSPMFAQINDDEQKLVTGTIIEAVNS